MESKLKTESNKKRNRKTKRKRAVVDAETSPKPVQAFIVGEHVFAKVKGFPDWPGKVSYRSYYSNNTALYHKVG